MKIRNKTTRANQIRQVKAGLAKHFANTPVVLAGTTYQPAALQKFLQADVDANDASTAARAAWIAAVKAARSADDETDVVLRAIHAMVTAQHGEAQDAETVLVDFGYAPRRKVTRTVEEKTAAVAQAKATREARHTMGPRAKAKVRGVVPASDPHPVESPPISHV
jgi:hypothetical protein